MNTVGTDENLLRVVPVPRNGSRVLPLELVPVLGHGDQISAPAPTKGYVQTGAPACPGTKSERGLIFRGKLFQLLNSCRSTNSNGEVGFQAYHHKPTVLSCSNPTLIMTFLHTVLRTKQTPSSSSIERKNSLYLHCTSNVAASEVTVPILLLAIHRYCPLSDLFTFVIVNCLLSEDKLILGEFRADPPLVHDIDGVGFPVALQDKITFSPSVGVLFCGCAVI